MSTWNLTGFWKTEGPPEDLYSARKLVWEMTLWLSDGICVVGRQRRSRETDRLTRRERYMGSDVSIGRQRVRVRTGETESEPLVKAKCSAYMPQVSEIKQKIIINQIKRRVKK